MKHIALVLLVLLLNSCGTPSGFDPALAAQEAENRARVYSAMATGTAQAPIIHITETAAELDFISTRNSMDLTSTAVLWTPTATPVPSITPSPTPNAEATGTFVALNAQSTQVALKIKIEEQRNNFYAVLPGIVFALVAGALIMTLIWLSRRERFRPAQVDERGNLLPMFDFVEGTATDPDNMPNYRGDLNETFSKMFKEWLRQKLNLEPLLPAITVDRQDAVKQRDQVSDMVNRGLPAGPKAEGKKQPVQEMAPQLPASLENRFKILEDGTHHLDDVVDAEIIQVLDHDWKEAEQK